MKALILNSGTGSRMGDVTKDKPKCLIEILLGETILDLQITALLACGICDFIITTGFYDEAIRNHIESRKYDASFIFVKNALYDRTNYIYSMYLAREHMDGDLVLMHGDMVFEASLLERFIAAPKKDMVIVRQGGILPEKDFKGKIKNNIITGISVHYEDDCKFLLPVYKLSAQKAKIWLSKIEDFVEADNVKVYAEDAFNEVADEMQLTPFYIEQEFCMEIDTKEDYQVCADHYIYMNERVLNAD